MQPVLHLGPLWCPYGEETPVGPNDIQRASPAPNGQTIRALVRGPVGGGLFTMRPTNAGELPDEYFAAAVKASIQAGVHKLLIPKGVLTSILLRMARPIPTRLIG